jgi:hypothetical protein
VSPALLIVVPSVRLARASGDARLFGGGGHVARSAVCGDGGSVRPCAGDRVGSVATWRKSRTIVALVSSLPWPWGLPAALARGEREQRLEQAVSRHVAADLTVRLSSLKQGHQRLSDRGVWDPRIVWSCSVAG